MRVTLLGPQRRPTLDTVAAAFERGGTAEEIVQQYSSEHETPEPVVAGQLSEERRQTVDRRGSTADRPGADLSASDIDDLDRRLQRRQLMGTAAIAVVGAVVYFMLTRETPRQDAAAPAAGVRAPTAPASSATGTAGGARTTSPSTTVGQRDGVHVADHSVVLDWLISHGPGKPPFESSALAIILRRHVSPNALNASFRATRVLSATSFDCRYGLWS